MFYSKNINFFSIFQVEKMTSFYFTLPLRKSFGEDISETGLLQGLSVIRRKYNFGLEIEYVDKACLIYSSPLF